MKKITENVSRRKIACSTGQSRWSIASTVCSPMPGYEKTYSIVIEPPMMKPSESAISVMIGSSALRKPCLRTIAQFESPLARAVST